MASTLQFCGAAQTVTGSKHLLTTNGKKILIDCGIFQGPRELRERNWQPFLFNPTELDAVVITHAHMDHIGMLPKLVKLGYRGPIWCTPATLHLSKISLPDSGRIQEEEARFHNRHQTSRHQPAEPLYTEADAYETLKQMRPVKYGAHLDLPGSCHLKFVPAGHILGSAFAKLTLSDGQVLLMSGDLGRYDAPIIPDPTQVKQADYLVMESTYGDRLHGDEDPMDVLDRVFNQAMRDGSCVLVPSFAIGRTQELLYYISILQDRNRLPRIPIFVDSPMAVSATALYDQSHEDHDEEMKLEKREGRDPLNPDYMQLIRDSNQSKALNSQRGPMVIIAGSGMATGGRIIHHLKHRLGDPSTVVLFTGYQGEGTMGRNMIDGAESVMIHGQEIPVAASVMQMTSLSAHADQGEMLRWLGGFESAPKDTFLVHGEPSVQEVLQDKITQDMGWQVSVPAYGETVAL